MELIRHRQNVIHSIVPNNGNRRWLKRVVRGPPSNCTLVPVDAIPQRNLTFGEPFVGPAMAPYFTGGQGTVTYSATGIPPSLTMDPATGVVTGTPTEAESGTYDAQVIAHDAAGCTATQPWLILVGAPVT